MLHVHGDMTEKLLKMLNTKNSYLKLTEFDPSKDKAKHTYVCVL